MRDVRLQFGAEICEHLGRLLEFNERRGHPIERRAGLDDTQARARVRLRPCADVNRTEQGERRAHATLDEGFREIERVGPNPADGVRGHQDVRSARARHCAAAITARPARRRFERAANHTGPPALRATA